MFDCSILIPDRPIAFNRDFVLLGIGITGALFLSQAIYWQRRAKDENGWWWKTREDWEEETGMQRRQQESSRERLKKLGILEEKREGLPARLYYRINMENVANRLISAKQVGTARTAQMVQNVPTVRDEASHLSIEETTTESTADIARARDTPNEPPADKPSKAVRQSTEDPRAEGFLEFKAVWPKGKWTGGIQAPLRAWIKAQCADNARLIIEDVKARQRDDRKWRDGFVPNPTTYLNQARWADDIDTGTVRSYGAKSRSDQWDDSIREFLNGSDNRIIDGECTKQ